MLIRMDFADVTVDRASSRPVVVLRDAENRSLPIAVGFREASAVASARERTTYGRGNTHDLLRLSIEALGATVECVEVCDYCDGAFFSIVRLRTSDGGSIEVDSRPSDAIALALRVGAPIWVHEDVLDAKGQVEDPRDRWRVYLESLEADDFGKYQQ